MTADWVQIGITLLIVFVFLPVAVVAVRCTITWLLSSASSPSTPSLFIMFQSLLLKVKIKPSFPPDL